jgi:hypothetical protein
MGMDSFVGKLNKNFEPDPNENIFASVWGEYEKVIMQSLITSFGLDFLVHDQYGGDVDTIHNVREIDKDPRMTYKNSANAADYSNRGDYAPSSYHKDARYIEINKKISESKKNGTLTDSYTGKTVARNSDIDLDHVIAAKEIHDDPGRVLAGLDGKDLANCNENLKPTDRSINRSMQDKDIETYLQKWEADRPQRQSRISELKGRNSLNDNERKELDKLEKLEQIDPDKMRSENKKARAAYETKLAKAYYTSPKFAKDVAAAAGSRGVEMGMRQAIGFVFVEIWMACKEELQTLPPGKDLKDILETVAHGVKKGFEIAKTKYEKILGKFGEGFISGTLASLTTTICNIFFTTAKNLVRCIRQIYASVVEAGKILLFNPDNLMFGDRIKTATVILATGASVLVGTSVGELIGKTPIAEIPIAGSCVTTFCSSLVSGLLSCTLLVCLDRSKIMNKVIDTLNRIPSEVNNYKEIADVLEILAAKLEDLDIAKFRVETEKYRTIAISIGKAETEEEINSLLLTAYKVFDIKIPWEDDFNTFMENQSNHLVFE